MSVESRLDSCFRGHRSHIAPLGGLPLLNRVRQDFRKEEKVKDTRKLQQSRDLAQVTRRQFVIRSAQLSLLAASLGLASCGPTEEPQSTEAPAAAPTAAPTAKPTDTPVPEVTTLVAGADSVGDNFDPTTQFQGWGTVWIWGLVHDRLVRSDFQKIEPMLASSWEVSDDGLVYTFKLREGIKFHDGTPLNAEAVEFNYMRLLDESHPYYNTIQVTSGSLLGGIKEVKATGEYEVTMYRDEPGAGTLAALCLFEGGIQSPKNIMDDPSGYGSHPVGTGPWMFKESVKGDFAEFDVNPDYWGGKPGIDRLVIRQIADDQALAAALLAGEIDLSPFIDFKDIPRFEADPNLNVVLTPAVNNGHIGFCSANPKLSDVRIRQAIAHGVDQQAIIDVIFDGHADPAGGYIPKAFWAFVPEFVDYYPRDVEKAKALLAEAGVDSGLSLTLLCQNTGFWPRLAEMIQAQLADIGVTVDVQKLDTSIFFQTIAEGEHDFFINDSTWSVPNPADVIIMLIVSSSTRSTRWCWSNDEFDALMSEQNLTLDEDKRYELLKEAQNILLDEAVNYPMYYAQFATVVNKKVKGFTPLPARIAYFDKVSY
jgi:peptide/nickel transport system substrate-binding protein